MKFILLDVPVYIRQGLQRLQHAIVQAETLAEFLRFTTPHETSKYDAAVIGGESLSDIRSVRRCDVVLPIIGLCPENEEITAEKRSAFLVDGGDDFLPVTVPINYLVTIASARTRLFKSGHTTDLKLRAPIRLLQGRVEIDPSRPAVLVDGRMLSFTNTEIKLLALLAKAPGVFHSRGDVMDYLEIDLDRSDRSVDSHVKRIRTRFNSAFPNSGKMIRVMYGLGYCIDPDFVLK